MNEDDICKHRPFSCHEFTESCTLGTTPSYPSIPPWRTPVSGDWHKPHRGLLPQQESQNPHPELPEPSSCFSLLRNYWQNIAAIRYDFYLKWKIKYQQSPKSSQMKKAQCWCGCCFPWSLEGKWRLFSRVVGGQAGTQATPRAQASECSSVYHLILL